MRVTPTDRASISDLNEGLKVRTIEIFNGNVPGILTFMQENYRKILGKGESHDNFITKLFRFLRIYKIKEFKQFVNARKVYGINLN